MRSKQSLYLALFLVATCLVLSAATNSLVMAARRAATINNSKRSVATTPVDCSDKLNVRTFTGVCNNLANPLWGSVDQTLDFSIEGLWNPQPADLPNERVLSNALFSERVSKLPGDFTPEERRTGISPDPHGRNMFFAIYGQFIGHDLSKADGVFDTVNFMRNFPIPVIDPTDPFYEPDRKLLLANPSRVDPATGAGINVGTAFIDAHPIYGYNDAVADTLRSHVGGKLLMDGDNLLPNGNTLQLENACRGVSASGAGDPRVDENPILFAIHNIWNREHNRRADELAAANPSWDDEKLFQEARKWVIALQQHIAINEFYPTYFGPGFFRSSFGPYKGYNPSTKPSTINVYGSAVDRIGHDLANLPLLYIQFNETDSTCTYGDGVPLGEGYPTILARCIKDYALTVGLKNIVRSSVVQYAQKIDGKVTDGLRYAFTPKSFAGNFDIEVIATFRGRQHSVPDFNTLRETYGLGSIYDVEGCVAGEQQDSIECFLEITNNATAATALQQFYRKVNRVEGYVGLIIESHRTEYDFPRTAAVIGMEQLRRLRDGDRFWYQRDGMFSKNDAKAIKKTLMSDIVYRNTGVKVPKHVFLAAKTPEEHRDIGSCF